MLSESPLIISLQEIHFQNRKFQQQNFVWCTLSILLVINWFNAAADTLIAISAISYDHLSLQTWHMQKQPPEVFCNSYRNFAKFTGKHLWQSLFLNQVAEVLSCEFCEISKNTFFYRTTPVATSAYAHNKHLPNIKRT